MARSVAFRSDLLSTDRVSVFFSPFTISMFVGNGPGSQDTKISKAATLSITDVETYDGRG
jgi:hypothetical protein